MRSRGRTARGGAQDARSIARTCVWWTRVADAKALCKQLQGNVLAPQSCRACSLSTSRRGRPPSRLWVLLPVKGDIRNDSPTYVFGDLPKSRVGALAVALDLQNPAAEAPARGAVPQNKFEVHAVSPLLKNPHFTSWSSLKRGSKVVGWGSMSRQYNDGMARRVHDPAVDGYHFSVRAVPEQAGGHHDSSHVRGGTHLISPERDGGQASTPGRGGSQIASPGRDRSAVLSPGRLANGGYLGPRPAALPLAAGASASPGGSGYGDSRNGGSPIVSMACDHVSSGSRPRAPEAQNIGSGRRSGSTPREEYARL